MTSPLCTFKSGDSATSHSSREKLLTGKEKTILVGDAKRMTEDVISHLHDKEKQKIDGSVEESQTCYAKGKHAHINLDSENDNDRKLKIRDLQNRLEKRNKLLDIIRKAYHRDVLSVKECVLQQQRRQQKQYDNDSMSETNATTTTDKNITASHHAFLSSELSLLSSIPSIDLRHQGFHLFSPQECELRLKPCLECGGCFEVIHRESSRYESLLGHRDELLQKIHGLEEKLEHTNQLLHNKTEEHSQFQNVTRQTNEEFRTKIRNLENHVIDYDELKLLSINQEKKIDCLTAVYQEKERMNEALENIKIDLIDQKKENMDQQISLNREKEKNQLMSIKLEDGFEREQRYKESIEALNNENNNLRKKVDDLDAKLSQRNSDLESCHTRILGLKKKIQQTVDDSLAKQNELEVTVEHREKSISELKAMLSSANQSIQQLEEALKTEKVHSEEYRSKVNKDLQIRQINEDKRISKETAIKNTLTNRIDFLMTLSSSYIQSLYELCIAQEDLIAVEDPSLLLTRATDKNRNRTKSSLIMESLENKIESIHIDWEGMLQDDDNRRKVFGNLNNRSQINMSHIDDLIKRIHAKNSARINHIQKRHEKETEETFSRHQIESIRLQKQISLKDSNYETLEKLSNNQREELKNALINIDELNEASKEKQRRIDILNLQVSDISEKKLVLQEDLSMVKIQLKGALNDMSLKDDEIKDQAETLNQLEGILQKTSTRFATMVEKEKRRIQTNVDVNVQIVIPTSDFSQQADFISPRQGRFELQNKKDQEIKKTIVNF